MTGKLSPEREVIAAYGAATFQEISMQAAINRVMHTYGMIENLPESRTLGAPEGHELSGREAGCIGTRLGC